VVVGDAAEEEIDLGRFFVAYRSSSFATTSSAQEKSIIDTCEKSITVSARRPVRRPDVQ
jgi:hypothetical protein